MKLLAALFLVMILMASCTALPDENRIEQTRTHTVTGMEVLNGNHIITVDGLYNLEVSYEVYNFLKVGYRCEFTYAEENPFETEYVTSLDCSTQFVNPSTILLTE